MSPERDEFEEDDDRDEFASRSIFAAGWFRAVLVLTVLAIVVVISLPYLLNWFEPAAPARIAKPAEAPKPPAGQPPAPAAVPAPAPAVTAPAREQTPAPPKAAPAAPAPTEKAAAKAPAEKPAADKPTAAAPDKAPAPTAPAKAEEKAPVKATEKAPARAADDKARAKAAETPAARASDKSAAKSVAKADSAAPRAQDKAPAKAVDKVTPEKAGSPARVAAKADTAVQAPAGAAGKVTGGNFWVQLGAFKEQQNAETLAKSLRASGFPVEITISRPTGAASVVSAPLPQHELFVSGSSPERVNAVLKGHGTAQPVSGGVAVKPTFTLQEAMTMSKRLTDEGLKVVIRPAGGAIVGAPAPAQGEGTLHVVRAGGYATRAGAVTARDELAAKGLKGFIAAGPAQ